MMRKSKGSSAAGPAPKVKSKKDEEPPVDRVLSTGTIITDIHLFPRCEYHTRYKGSTCFDMKDPQFWCTYFRTTSRGGGFDRYESLHLGKTYPDDQMYTVVDQAHNTGNFLSPFAHKEYQEAYRVITHLQPAALTSPIIDRPLIYDQLLEYKNTICGLVIKAVQDLGSKTPVEHVSVWHTNAYPCVMVQVKCPIRGTEGVSKDWHRLAMGYYIAIVNDCANKEKIPIEIVARSSFGHNIPSVSETKDTFRINVGLVPRIYSMVLAKSIVRLDLRIATLIAGHIHIPGSVISSQHSKIAKPNKAIKKLNSDIEEHNKAITGRKGKKQLKNYYGEWNQDLITTLSAQGNTGPGLIIHELTRFGSYIDMLVDAALEDEIRKPDLQRYESVGWGNVLSKFEYTIDRKGETHVSLEGCTSLCKTVAEQSTFSGPEHDAISKDDEFWALIGQIREALRSDILIPHISSRNIAGLSASLERANLEFMQHRSEVDKDSAGSDSDVEVQSKDQHFFSRKLTVVTGMKAINLAVILAKYYCNFFLGKSCTFDTSFMYYETGGAVELLSNVFSVYADLKHTSTSVQCIDLTHCSSKSPEDTVSLDKVKAKHVIILDYTSATTRLIREAVNKFLKPDTLVLLVSSGLKNEQAGADINPYGTVRIIATNRYTMLALYKAGLHIVKTKFKVAPQGKTGRKADEIQINSCLPPLAHQIRREYKSAGFIVTNSKIFAEQTLASAPRHTTALTDQEFDRVDKIFAFWSMFSHVDEIKRMRELGVQPQDIHYIFTHNGLLFQILGCEEYFDIIDAIGVVSSDLKALTSADTGELWSELHNWLDLSEKISTEASCLLKDGEDLIEFLKDKISVYESASTDDEQKHQIFAQISERLSSLTRTQASRFKRFEEGCNEILSELGEDPIDDTYKADLFMRELDSALAELDTASAEETEVDDKYDHLIYEDQICRITKLLRGKGSTKEGTLTDTKAGKHATQSLAKVDTASARPAPKPKGKRDTGGKSRSAPPPAAGSGSECIAGKGFSVQDMQSTLALTVNDKIATSAAVLLSTDSLRRWSIEVAHMPGNSPIMPAAYLHDVGSGYHWTALVALSRSIVVYMDSENNPIPADVLMNIPFVTSFPVHMQRPGECGPDTVHNIAWVVDGAVNGYQRIGIAPRTINAENALIVSDATNEEQSYDNTWTYEHRDTSTRNLYAVSRIAGSVNSWIRAVKNLGFDTSSLAHVASAMSLLRNAAYIAMLAQSQDLSSKLTALAIFGMEMLDPYLSTEWSQALGIAKSTAFAVYYPSLITLEMLTSYASGICDSKGMHVQADHKWIPYTIEAVTITSILAVGASSLSIPTAFVALLNAPMAGNIAYDFTSMLLSTSVGTTIGDTANNMWHDISSADPRVLAFFGGVAVAGTMLPASVIAFAAVAILAGNAAYGFVSTTQSTSNDPSSANSGDHIVVASGDMLNVVEVL